jgi:F-box domain
MASFQDLPEETVSSIFSYLNPKDYQSSRRVCRGWRRRLRGCAGFSWASPSAGSNIETHVTGVVLKGHRVVQGLNPESYDTMKYMRVLGHFREPKVISSRMHLANEPPLRFCAWRKSVAFCMEQHGNRLVWDTMDLSFSACLITKIHPQRRETPEGPAVQILRRTKPLLKRLITHVDLSGLQDLKRLSLRGCTHLQTAHVPASLEALDVSSCAALSKLVFPSRQEGRLEALNLRGCRSLVAQDRSRLFGFASADVMRYIKDLDMSSTTLLDPAILADAIRMTCNLESVSLRYVATNAVIRALADSESSKTTLRFVDASFSEDLNDESCEELFNSALYLERISVRACPSVSPSFYNSITTRLDNRRKATDGTLLAQDESIPILAAAPLDERADSSSSNVIAHTRGRGDVIPYPQAIHTLADSTKK